MESDVSERVLDLQSLAVEVEPITENVFKIEGEGAIFLVNTDAGAVLIDTGTPYPQTLEQIAAIREVASGPVRKIVLTHAHSDHSGGLKHWKDRIDSGEIELIGHHRYAYMARLQDDFLPYFKRRYKPLYPNRVTLGPEPPRVHWEMEPTREVYPGADYRFELGGVEFVVIAPENGGEGEDGVLVWLPESRILFTGDLFGTLYPMFPNLYTVRGEKYRDPLDYIDALDLVLALRPEVIAHTHFRVIRGRGVHPGERAQDARRRAIHVGRRAGRHERGQDRLGADARRPAAPRARALPGPRQGFVVGARGLGDRRGLVLLRH